MSKHHGWSECTASCESGANEVDEARGKLIQKCIKGFVLAALGPVMGWSCRAAALADIADSLRRLVEEMPVDAQASFHLQDVMLQFKFTRQKADAKIAAQKAMRPNDE